MTTSGICKKKRIRWTPELHQRFLLALVVLGDNAKPSDIMREMNIPGLTRRHVSSHLQKYRLSNLGDPSPLSIRRKPSKDSTVSDQTIHSVFNNIQTLCEQPQPQPPQPLTVPEVSFVEQQQPVTSSVAGSSVMCPVFHSEWFPSLHSEIPMLFDTMSYNHHDSFFTPPCEISLDSPSNNMQLKAKSFVCSVK